MNLGERLFELRKAKNLTQDDVAQKLNITRQTVSKWETNQSTPDFDKILPLCELYEITTDELLKGEKQEKPEESNSNDNDKDKEKDGKLNYENMTRNQIKQKSAEVICSSVLIFLVAIAYAGIGVSVLMWNPVIVGCTFLILVGWGVIRIVKHYMSIPKFEKTKEEKKQDKIEKQIKDIIAGIGTAIYFIVSFSTMAWHVTWIIFIIIGMIEGIVNLIFMIKGDEENEE